MKIDQFEFPDDLYYDREHGWARIDGDVATMGMTDFGQSLANEIIFVETPRTGRHVDQGAAFMSLESGKWVGRVKAVVSGEIIEVNEELEWETALVNESPYGEGWLVKLRLSDAAELDGLMQPADPAFAEFIASERDKYEV